MDSIKPVGSAINHQAGLKGGKPPASSSPEPQDSVSVSSNHSTRKPSKRGRKNSSQVSSRGSGTASTLSSIYFRSGGRGISFSREKDSKTSSGVQWQLNYGGPGGGGSQVLSQGAPAGTIIQDDGPGSEPLGRLMRTDDGWLGESVIESNLPYTLISSSKLITYLGDDGRAEMTLIELWRLGGGAVYRLDADGYLENPHYAPRVLQRYFFEDDEIDKAPAFDFHASPRKRELSSLDRFFGPHVTRALMKKMPPSQEHPEGGWSLRIRRSRGRASDKVLNNEQPVGHREDRGPHEKTILDTWERIEGGWQSIDNAKATPENYLDMESAHLKTILTDDGQVQMTLYENYMDGESKVFILDGQDYLKDPGKKPTVLAGQSASGGSPVDEASLRADGLKRKYSPALQESPEKTTTIEQEEEWLIVDGLKIPIQKQEN